MSTERERNLEAEWVARLRAAADTRPFDLPSLTDGTTSDAAPARTVPDLLRRRLLGTVRAASAERRLREAARVPAVDVAAGLRSARLSAKLSEDEVAARLSLTPDQVRMAEQSTASMLSWPASSIADLLDLLDVPLAVLAASAHPSAKLSREEPRSSGRQRAASVAPSAGPLFPPTLSEAARILCERGREDLLSVG